jgi:two-component system, chemotaxis family, sensor histidine kinase and response regulator PixL
MNDSQIQAQAYGYFLTEAPELLQTIEQEILTLPSNRTTAKVHNLMRALHTLKGAAANVRLATIERIAHDLEDVARVFYNLEVEIDLSIQSLLLDGYAGLQECLNAQMMDLKIDEQAIVDRLVVTIDRLKLKLGDWSDTEIELPTAIELGFDIVASIFETTIQEQIDALSQVIATYNPTEIAACLHSIAEVGIGLAESLELPGFLAIDRAIIAALANYPDRIESIANLALQNIQQAQIQVLAGDRVNGGTVCADLANLAQNPVLEITTPLEPEFIGAGIITTDPVQVATVDAESSPEQLLKFAVEAGTPLELKSNQILVTAAGEAELPAFQSFLTSDRFRKRNVLSTDTQHLFDRIIRLCWDWFRQQIQTPHSELNFETLIAAEGLANLDYIHRWIELLLQSVGIAGDRLSLQLYRQCCIYQVVFAIAKYLADREPRYQITPEFLIELRLQLQASAEAYQLQPPVTASERGWIDRIILPHHWERTSVEIDRQDCQLSEIWEDPKLSNNFG